MLASSLSVTTARRNRNPRESCELGQKGEEGERLELVFSGRNGDFAHRGTALSRSAESPLVIAVQRQQASVGKNRRDRSGNGGAKRRNE